MCEAGVAVSSPGKPTTILKISIIHILLQIIDYHIGYINWENSKIVFRKFNRVKRVYSPGLSSPWMEGSVDFHQVVHIQFSVYLGG